MGQPITMVLNEQEHAELQRRAEAEKRTLDEVAHTMLSENSANDHRSPPLEQSEDGDDRKTS